MPDQDQHALSSLNRGSMRNAGYAISQRVRKRIEEAFGWAKAVAGLGKTKLRGYQARRVKFTFAKAA